jgi:hypothetical protein
VKLSKEEKKALRKANKEKTKAVAEEAKTEVRVFRLVIYMSDLVTEKGEWE